MSDEIIREVYEVLESRRDNPIDSYTSNIMKDSDKKAEDKILEKIAEEAGEVIIASKNDENLVYESVDLIFHTLLLLTYKGIELDEVFDEFADRITAQNVKVENMLSAGTVLTGNRTLVYTIIRNLVENSLKYAGEGITIHLECYSMIEKFCYITYYDTGEGVPQEHLDQIFERFYRIEEGRTRDVGGSGLGLSIVKNAVKFHGGDISVINRQWGGLQFFFSLRRQAD